MYDRPDPSEYHEYYQLYTRRVPDGDVLETLAREIDATAEYLGSLTPEQEAHRYAPDKWSAREVVGHLIDTERVFALRALWFARGAPTALPPFEEKDWGEASNARERPMRELVDELVKARASHLAMFHGLDAEAGMRRGIASGREFSVRSIVWILAGHELHHRAILQERYFPG